MTTAVAALTAGYIALAVLLLSLNLTSLWRWWIKAGAIIATTIFFGVTFQALGGLTGWPTTQRLPDRFALVWSTVVEPDKKTNNPGGVYIWAQELTPTTYPRPSRAAISCPIQTRSRARWRALRRNASTASR